MYKYYLEFIHEEHMLFAREIAVIVNEAHDLPEPVSEAKIHAIIRKYMKENNIREQKLFFKTTKGLMRVYPKEIWANAITYFLNKKTAN